MDHLVGLKPKLEMDDFDLLFELHLSNYLQYFVSSS